MYYNNKLGLATADIRSAHSPPNSPPAHALAQRLHTLERPAELLEIPSVDICRSLIYVTYACIDHARTIGQATETLLSVLSTAGVGAPEDEGAERARAKLDVGVRDLPPPSRRRLTSGGVLARASSSQRSYAPGGVLALRAHALPSAGRTFFVHFCTW